MLDSINNMLFIGIPSWSDHYGCFTIFRNSVVPIITTDISNLGMSIFRKAISNGIKCVFEYETEYHTCVFHRIATCADMVTVINEKQNILGFAGSYRFLSNFYQSQLKSPIDGLVYGSVEAAYQAAKTDNLEIKKEFQSAMPGEAKKYGRTIAIRADWDDVKVDVMHQICREKFKNARLKEKLIATGDSHLEETNIWGDFFWGVCDGVGENNLGKILMKIREDIRMERWPSG